MELCYRTTNFQLAAYLKTVKTLTFKGTKPLPSDTRKLAFLFFPQSLAKQAATQFYAGTATAVAYELFQNFNSLKDMIFEAVRQEKI